MYTPLTQAISALLLVSATGTYAGVLYDRDDCKTAYLNIATFSDYIVALRLRKSCKHDEIYTSFHQYPFISIVEPWCGTYLVSTVTAKKTVTCVITHVLDAGSC